VIVSTEPSSRIKVSVIVPSLPLVIVIRVEPELGDAPSASVAWAPGAAKNVADPATAKTQTDRNKRFISFLFALSLGTLSQTKDPTIPHLKKVPNLVQITKNQNQYIVGPACQWHKVPVFAPASGAAILGVSPMFCRIR
jgi:hypothetical protein